MTVEAHSSTLSDAAHPRAQALDVVVLEISQSAGAGFAASLLADFGARVYIAETPPAGSRLRTAGPRQVGPGWWDIVARNKRSLAIDVTRPDAAPVMTRLLSGVNMVITDIGKPNWPSDPCCLLIMPAPAGRRCLSPGADRPDLWPWSTPRIIRRRQECSPSPVSAMVLLSSGNAARRVSRGCSGSDRRAAELRKASCRRAADASAR